MGCLKIKNATQKAIVFCLPELGSGSKNINIYQDSELNSE